MNEAYASFAFAAVCVALSVAFHLGREKIEGRASAMVQNAGRARIGGLIVSQENRRTMTNRELDVWLAEHAFNKRIFTQDEMMSEATKATWLVQPLCRAFHMGFEALGPEEFRQLIPAYSTDQVASDALLDRMVELDWSWQGTFINGICFWSFLNGEGKCFSSHAKSKHEAIALAAKVALESLSSARFRVNEGG